MGKRVNGNSGAVHSLPASPRSGVVERNRQNKKNISWRLQVQVGCAVGYNLVVRLG